MSGTKLAKIQSEAKLAGVCAGIGRYMSIDPTIVRLGFVFATIFGFGSPVLIYFILALVMPNK